MSKVIVNADECIGCGACVGAHSDIFAFNDDGKAEVIADGDEADIADAIASCPVQAIVEE